MPATWGAAMLVPNIRVVPPPRLVDKMPTDWMKHPRLTFSASSPGAETTPPAPSVVKYEAVSAAIGELSKRHLFDPASAVVLATGNRDQ